MSRLDQLVDDSREAEERRSREVPAEELERRLEGREEPRPFGEALQRPGLSLITEFKRSSPSAGEIRPGAEVAQIVSAYERGGAAALSVLTEERSFGGSLADVRAARQASGLPILRKDFVTSRYGLLETAAAGADAVLLIVAALGDRTQGMLERAWELDIDCLVEVHADEELEIALEAGADIIGINNRDLRDLSVDLGTTAELITDVPAGKIVVSESGYSDRSELVEAERIGVDAVLVGESLMRAEDPERALAELAVDADQTREHYIPRDLL
ncbi:indole-3-glycerol phosphate synthase TrpC [Thermoleophilia bacterium SCSIO 60948]|nr:indole-3-glycerol phosphate synthase TrpC [Thermoleophilia bacterium SCSIO 60948]